FFFQAEDGIRDFHVTGVQTCALPISRATNRRASIACPTLRTARQRPLRQRERRTTAVLQHGKSSGCVPRLRQAESGPHPSPLHRSEERRVGKECSKRWCRNSEIIKHM